MVVGGRSHLRSSIPCRHSALWHHRLYASCLLVRVVPFRAPFLGGSFFYSYRENFKKSAAKLGGCAQAHRTFGQSRSSPTGFEKNLHPAGSIFLKNLDSRATPAFSRAFSFLFFPFFFSLLKKYRRSAASKTLMAHCMKSFRIKTHRPESIYQQPHFFILNKGLNSGKPLNQPCPNCFVCLTDNQEDREFLYWLSFGLWKSKAFHYYLKGSLIPFITISEIRRLIQDSSAKAICNTQSFQKAIHPFDYSIPTNKKSRLH